MTQPPLPPSTELDIGALTRLFGNTTNSYKYLFFLSLLDILKRRHFEVRDPVSFPELTIEVLANAWFPHVFFRLSFGSKDKIAETLDFLNPQVDDSVKKLTDTDKLSLRNTIRACGPDLTLMRFVPYRIIRPFFEAETQGLPDHKVDSRLENLANQQFHSRRPLFGFANKKAGILIHPAWGEYLKVNFLIVQAWVSWNWLGYMQARNPNTPAIGNKLFPPSNRASLHLQTKYWQLILANQTSELNCIYSGQPMKPDQKLSLDHFLPWSFVTHDQLWNLIPTFPGVNSSKSDNVPSLEKYLEKMIFLQHQGLNTAHRILGPKWYQLSESFASDLRISDLGDLLDLPILTKQYQATIGPLVLLARNQGFVTEWVF